MTAQAQSRDLTAPEPVRGEVVHVGGGSLMEVISRAATDPATDVDKLERLLGMYERITARDAEQSYHAAMNAAQEEMRPIAADANNPQTRSRYASYAALDRALRPIYTKHGFSISFDTADGAAADHLRVVAKVGHRDGHKEVPHLDMPADGKGAKGGDVMTKTHATGAAITYGKRYLLGMVFNIAVGEDTDGNAPKSPREMSAAGQRAITAINQAEGPAALALWKKQEAGKVAQEVTPGELQIISDTYNRRVEALKAGDE